MGRRGRPDRFDGVLVVDKPAGMTSHDVVAVVRRAAGQRRVGHTGTLDPAATGVLVVCLGRTTRLARFLQAGAKTYVADVRFGVTTTSQDADGEVVATADASHLTAAAVDAALDRFRGEIEQVPPMVSALKVGGERLHEKARRGEEVERAPRQITITALEVDGFTAGEHASARLTVTCSAGTYVRTLAHDLGQALGVGASLTALRRTRNGGFDLDAAATLEVVTSSGDEGRLGELVLPPDEAVRGLPQVRVTDDDLLRRLAHGQPLPAAGHDGWYAVTAEVPTSEGPVVPRLVGIYADRDGQGRAEVVLLRPEDLPQGASEGADAAPSRPPDAPPR